MSKPADISHDSAPRHPADPELIQKADAPPWLRPAMVALAVAAAATLFVVAPVLAGPPSRSEPWQALAWLPLVALGLYVGAGIALLAILLAGASLHSILLKRHAIRPFFDSPHMDSLLLLLVVGLSLIPGVALARTLGWDHPAAVLACGLLIIVGIVVLHEGLILVGWLHEEEKDCCHRSTVGRPEPLNRIATELPRSAPEPAGAIRAFGGNERDKTELLAALAEQRRRGPIVREQPEAICDFRIRLGCPVPCQRTHTATDGDPDRNLDDHHRLWHMLHGVPAPLSSLEDAVFSNLPLKLATEWPERFVSAIPVGADLAPTADHWLLWLLTEANSPLAPVDERLDVPAGLLRRRLAGDEPSPEEWGGVPGFSDKQWCGGAIAGISGAVARAGLAGSNPAAAREIGLAALHAASAATHLQAHAIAADRREARERAQRDAPGPVSRALARTRWLAGTMKDEAADIPYETARERVWRQMADRLVELTAAS